MVSYKCFFCNKKVSKEMLGKRVRCLYCGGKILFKSSSTVTKFKAR